MAMIEYPAPDAWKAFGDAVRARRLELGYTQDEAAERGGVSGTTWRNIEKANGTSYRALSLSGVCRALDWPPNAYSQILFTTGGVEEGVTVDVDERIAANRLDTLEERQDDMAERLARLEAEVRRRAGGSDGRSSTARSKSSDGDGAGAGRGTPRS